MKGSWLVLLMLIFLQSFCPSWSSPLRSIPDQNLAQYVVEHLDLGSFSSSVSNHMQASKSTFSDYGFVPEHIWNREAVLEAPAGDWIFDIRVLRHDRGSITVCVHDFSQGKQHFDRETILLLHQVPGTDRLEASRSTWTAEGD